MYRLTIRHHAIKALQRMSARDARRVRDALDKLAQDPDRRDIDVARLQGSPGFRLRTGGLARHLRSRDEMKGRVNSHVLRIGPRGDVYNPRRMT